jgi:hypothetical protein
MLPEVGVPLLEVTVWATAPVLVQQTVVPTGTLTLAGMNPKSKMVILVSPDPQGVVAAGADRVPPGRARRMPAADSAISA